MMVAVRRILSAVLAGCLVVSFAEAASARQVRKHVRVYHHVRTHHVRVAPIIEGSPVGIALGEVGPGIPGATTAAPYPPGYGFYGPGYGFYGPGYGFPGY